MSDLLVQQLVPSNRKVDLRNELTRRSYSLNPFDDIFVKFSNDLSKAILRSSVIGRLPAFVALSFWLRRSNVRLIIDENVKNFNQLNVTLSPRGMVFHICPSNVDTMFIYSLIISLLVGNRNVLRISPRINQPTINEVFVLMNEILSREQYKSLKDYVKIIVYERNSEINAFLSENSDARLIWGGDETIRAFKKVSSKDRIKDIYFSDRFSFALIDTCRYINLDEKKRYELVKLFFNDTYTFDQKGCSSPQLIFTLGTEEQRKIFTDDFYNRLEKEANSNYDYDQASLASLKLNQLAEDAINDIVSDYSGRNTNLIMASLKDKVIRHSCGGGYFYCKNLKNIGELIPFINSKIQTISYFGLETSDIDEISKLTQGLGVDRIVPIGKALEFHYIWDGYNLIEELTNKRYIL